MKIAVLSGKGGTGKTTVAASLARVIKPSCYVDCDVEEPNGYVFLKPEFVNSVPVRVEVPVADEFLCTGCGECARVCQFNVLAVIRAKPLVFPELCHHCGACFIVCKPKALTPELRTVGVVESNKEGTVLQGKLDIGEPVTIPVIIELKKHIRDDVPVILDSSPGASCTVVQTIDGCDYCVLVTEPTPFGLHDLKIAVSLVRKMGMPFGVVINKAMDNNRSITDFCEKENIDIILEIPYSRQIAEEYSKGILPVDSDVKWQKGFELMFRKIKEKTKK
jgi:MinD superfamily P-loop ATPase